MVFGIIRDMSRKKKVNNTRQAGEEAAAEPPATVTASPEPPPEEQPVEAEPADSAPDPAVGEPADPAAGVASDPSEPLPEEVPADPSMTVAGDEETPAADLDLQELPDSPMPVSVSPDGDGEAGEDLEASPEPSPGGEPVEVSADEISTERVVEAVLFAADAPLPPQKIVAILGTGTVREVRKIVEALNQSYARGGHAFRIEEIAGGYQILTLPQYNTWLRRLKQSRQESKLSPAAMETLAVVAYKQPVVRAQIEAVRGVSVGEVLNRLRELGLVKIVGRDEDVGRPLLYGTTRRFLETFGLSSLEDLPAVEELQMPK